MDRSKPDVKKSLAVGDVHLLMVGGPLDGGVMHVETKAIGAGGARVDVRDPTSDTEVSYFVETIAKRHVLRYENMSVEDMVEQLIRLYPRGYER